MSVEVIGLSDKADRGTIDDAIISLGLRLLHVEHDEGLTRLCCARSSDELVDFVQLTESKRWYAMVRAHAPEDICVLIREELGVSDNPPEARDLDLRERAERFVRPRLAQFVSCRLHLSDESSRVILTNHETGAVLEIDYGSYVTLTLADGTRDLEGLALAQSERDLYGGRNRLGALLVELAAQGMLAEGLPTPPSEPPVSRPTIPDDAPIARLPEYGFDCDGAGSCCRQYGSIRFTDRERRLAELAATELELPIPAGEAFTPMQGASPSSRHNKHWAVAQSEGACIFFAEDRCELHSVGGARAKPLPCQIYPRVLTFDGEQVRVSVTPECACVFATREVHIPLLPETMRIRSDLEPGVAILSLPDPVPISARHASPRDCANRWIDALCQRLTHSFGDTADLLWSLSNALEARGLEEGPDAVPIVRPTAREVHPWLDALARRAKANLSTHRSWRGAWDVSRLSAEWIGHALRALAENGTLPPADNDRPEERLYARTLAFSHRLALEGRTWVHGLRDRAVRIWCARQMQCAPHPSEPHLGPALALLEAGMRNLGFTSYADELGR